MDTLKTRDLVIKLRSSARLLLGALLLLAGLGHLTTQRKEFQAQVPNWIPMNKDDVVVVSGIAELVLAIALIALPNKRRFVGQIAAAFFIAVFPGNVSQYQNHVDAFGLNTDQTRFKRLLFQPLLVLWALWSTSERRENKY
jgi:uncharacterized membrane protein